MILRRSLQQLFRKPRLVLIYGLLFCLLTAMLSIGLLLMQSSVSLSQQAEDAYTTIGVPDFYSILPADDDFYRMKARLEQGDISPEAYLEGHARYLQGKGYEQYRFPMEDGTIVYDGDAYQEFRIQAENYDLAGLTDFPYVLEQETRARYGAYVPAMTDRQLVQFHHSVEGTDLLIFTYTGQEILQLNWDFQEEERSVPVKVVDSLYARMIGQDFFIGETTELPFLLHLDSNLYDLGRLEPGKTYITVCDVYPIPEYWPQHGGAVSLTPRVTIPFYYRGTYRHYDTVNGKEVHAPVYDADPILFQEYTEDFWDTEAGARFAAIRQALEVNYQSAAVMTTNDLQLMQAFYNEELYARQGRLITRAECDRGDEVCMVSCRMAQANGWQVGDRLELSLYQCESFDAFHLTGFFTRNFQTFFAEGQDFFSTQSYEIVGLYDGPAVEDPAPTLQRDENDQVIDPDLPDYLVSNNVILVPDRSVQAPPTTRYSSDLTTTIRLKNGMVEQYLEDLEKGGLLQPDADGVRVELTFYDQGYYYADQLAESTGTAARIIIALAAAAALICVVLFSYLYVSRRRGEMAIMRALGISKARIGLSLLLCLLLVTMVSAAAGAGLGFLTIDFVEGLFAADEDARLINLFSATYGQGINKSEELSLIRTPAPFVLSAGAVILLVAGVVWVMLMQALRKSPMTLLSRKGERT